MPIFGTFEIWSAHRIAEIEFFREKKNMHLENGLKRPHINFENVWIILGEINFFGFLEKFSKILPSKNRNFEIQRQA